MGVIEGSAILKTGFWSFLQGKHVFHADVRVSGIFEEITFIHERQEAEFEFVMVPSSVSLLPGGGECPPVDLPRDTKGLVDQTSSRSEHHFAGQ